MTSARSALIFITTPADVGATTTNKVETIKRSESGSTNGYLGPHETLPAPLQYLLVADQKRHGELRFYCVLLFLCGDQVGLGTESWARKKNLYHPHHPPGQSFVHACGVRQYERPFASDLNALGSLASFGAGTNQ